MPSPAIRKPTIDTPSTGTRVARTDPTPAMASASRWSVIEPTRTCTQSPPRRPVVMPTVNSRNAALATPALESKSMLRRNAAQSPFADSSSIAVARTEREQDARGAEATSADRTGTTRVRLVRLVGTEEAGRDEQQDADQCERDRGQVYRHADAGTSGEDGHDGAGDAAETPEPVEPVHHRRGSAGAQLRALHVHRDVDEHVEEQQPDEPGDQHGRCGGEADDRQRPDRQQRSDDQHPPGPEAGDHPTGEEAPDQPGDGGEREHEAERADRDADPVADLRQLRDERGVDDAVGEELGRHRLQRPAISRATDAACTDAFVRRRHRR